MRVGRYEAAVRLAQRLLVAYPGTLPLHLALGRAQAALAGPGSDFGPAAAHLQRLLVCDPDNWPLRLELALLYLQGDDQQQLLAERNLWKVAQSAPGHSHLTAVLKQLGKHPWVAPLQSWQDQLTRNEAQPDGSQEVVELISLAHLYLKRQLPWMAVQYFEDALVRQGSSTPNSEIMSGLLLAWCRMGRADQMHKVATDLLQERPQLFLPRLVLALTGPDDEARALLQPIWRLDPLMWRTRELADTAWLDVDKIIPPGIPWYDSPNLFSRQPVQGDDEEWEDWLERMVKNERDEMRCRELDFRVGEPIPPRMDFAPAVEPAPAQPQPKAAAPKIRTRPAPAAEPELASLAKGPGGATLPPRPVVPPQISFGTTIQPQNGQAVIVTSEKALTQKYGTTGYAAISRRLEELGQALAERGLGGRVLKVDSPTDLARYNLQPVKLRKPQDIARLLNTALPVHNDNAIDYVFIIGGPDIIPLWQLPNPTFDSDHFIMSDNPYGSHDQTYLLPERIVGRLPDEGDSHDPALLIKLLDAAIQRHRTTAMPKLAMGLPLRLLDRLFGPVERVSKLPPDKIEQFIQPEQARLLHPFVYSAAAWQQSTLTLRQAMTNSTVQTLFSPPVSATSLDRKAFQAARLLHFNLHGFPENNGWYGQDSTQRLVLPKQSNLPLAFSLEQAGQLQSQSAIVFSEACYGGRLPDKGQGMAHKLLASGAAAVIGSTAVSYGSAGANLACAGLLAYYFWKGVLAEGQSVGLALQQARLNFTRRRLAEGQNLTTDDTKTLLEFGLLGDPTATMHQSVSDLLMPKGLRRDEGVLRSQAGSGAPHQYRAIPPQRLPIDLRGRLQKVLAWLLPDPEPDDWRNLQTLIDLDAGGSSSRHAKGGALGELLVVGHRPLQTEEGFEYQQAFHLRSNLDGAEVSVELSRGLG